MEILTSCVIRNRTHIRSALLLACVLFCLSSTSPAARRQEVSVAWEQLPSLLMGKKVMIATLSGLMIEGRVLGAGDSHLSLDVTKSSNQRRLARGPQEIPRGDVTVIQLETIEGNGRLIGTLAGAGGGVAAGWGVAEGVFHTSGEGDGVLSEPEGVASILGIGAGAGAVGYLLGRNSDTTITYLKIQP